VSPFSLQCGWCNNGVTDFHWRWIEMAVLHGRNARRCIFRQGDIRPRFPHASMPGEPATPRLSVKHALPPPHAQLAPPTAPRRLAAFRHSFHSSVRLRTSCRHPRTLPGRGGPHGRRDRCSSHAYPHRRHSDLALDHDDGGSTWAQEDAFAGGRVDAPCSRRVCLDG
jgi:hypothetical protein